MTTHEPLRARQARASSPRRRLRVGIVELIVDAVTTSAIDRLYAAHFKKQFAGIVPQAVAVWCRELGHEVFYTTYYGQDDPRRLLPDDLDVVFVASFTQASALAYALATLFRREGTLTVIGGPHARSFPGDCLRYFDLVVHDCDKALIDDILRRRFDVPAVIASGRVLADLPTVEERLPEITASAFTRGRPTLTSFVPVLASLGCPYSCDFCVDWNSRYAPLPKERLAADLRFLSERFPGTLVIYHDPNFAIRFDETMDVIETVPEGRRNPYLMESSLAVLKESRLRRLQSTNCVYVAPGIESWSGYGNKAGVGSASGRDKLERVIAHFRTLRGYVSGLQANFILGTDADAGDEPVALTKEFIRRLPSVWPALNIPIPFGGTPLFDRCLAEGRIVRPLPFAFYYKPYLTSVLANYDPLSYYGHLADLYALITSNAMLARRLLARSVPAVKAIYAVRTLHLRQELAEIRRIRLMLAEDTAFRAFHEGRSDILPEFYHQRFERRLGRYAELIPRPDRRPLLDGMPPARARDRAA
ncbi:MAG: radical SAM protein [Alphaproteobacteria bacterium]